MTNALQTRYELHFARLDSRDRVTAHGTTESRRSRELTDDAIAHIADAYHGSGGRGRGDGADLLLWLTGFDAPSLHTMYVDKPMRGHGLMQAIARVNRVFRDKPGGLVVDYLGLAHELKRALATYTQSGGTGETALDKERAVRAMLEKYEVCCGLFHGFDRSAWTDGSPAERLQLLPAALEHVLAQEDGKARCLWAVRELSQAFALAVPHPETVRIRDDVSLFQHVRAALSKRVGPDAKSDEELDHAVRQIVSRAVAPDGVVDIFAAGRTEEARCVDPVRGVPA